MTDTTDPGPSLTTPERETVVNVTEADDLVRVWTAIRRHIGRLRRDPAFTEVDSGYYGSTAWAEFTIPAEDWTPAGVKRVRRQSPEQIAAASARMKALTERRAAAKQAADGESTAQGAHPIEPGAIA